MAKIDEILRRAVALKASDIHFSAGSPVMIRKHGDLVPLDEKVYSDVELLPILLEIIDDKDKKRFNEHKNLDKSYSVEGAGNFRLNFFWTRRGAGAVIRWLPTRMPEIDDLGLPAVVKKLADLPKGLLLVTGPTGSGKSTTLAAIINYMNTNFAYHILTVEDPVEFVHPCKKSLINQREIGQSCLTFSDALKYALREDPDVILVGEMRDQETIGLALTAAETGHLVLGTLHTRGAASAVDRIIESFPSSERPLIRVMLSESLRAVISQILIKGKDGSSRVAAYEVMVSNYAISNLIREGKTFQIPSILQTAKGEGMLQMESHIRQLMAQGLVDPVEADAVLSSMMRANQSSNNAGSSGGAPSGAGTLPGAAPGKNNPLEKKPAAPSNVPVDKTKQGAKPAVPPQVQTPPVNMPKVTSKPAAQPVILEKAEKVQKTEKFEKTDKVEKPVMPAVKLEKIEKIEKVEKIDKVEKIEKLEKVEKVEKIEVAPKPVAVQKPVVQEKPAVVQKPIMEVSSKTIPKEPSIKLNEEKPAQDFSDKTVAGITISKVAAAAKAPVVPPSIKLATPPAPAPKPQAPPMAPPVPPAAVPPTVLDAPAKAHTSSFSVSLKVPAPLQPPKTPPPSAKVPPPPAPVAPKSKTPPPVDVPSKVEELTKSKDRGGLNPPINRPPPTKKVG